MTLNKHKKIQSFSPLAVCLQLTNMFCNLYKYHLYFKQIKFASQPFPYTKFFSWGQRPFSAVVARGMQPVATAAATGGSSFQSPGGKTPVKDLFQKSFWICFTFQDWFLQSQIWFSTVEAVHLSHQALGREIWRKKYSVNCFLKSSQWLLEFSLGKHTKKVLFEIWPQTLGPFPF